VVGVGEIINNGSSILTKHVFDTGTQPTQNGSHGLCKGFIYRARMEIGDQPCYGDMIGYI
jgi:hypothetical protein